MYLPEPLPEGDDLQFKALYNWCNRMRDYVQSITPQPGVGTRLTRTPTGHIYSVPRQNPGIGAQLIPCMITELFSAAVGSPVDYIGVTQWDPVNAALTGEQFLCAKCIPGRQPGVETIDGIEIVYTQYQDDVQRLASFTIDSALTEWHTVHPRYIVYSAEEANMDMNQTFLFAMQVQGGTGIQDQDQNEIMFLEDQPNRYWVWNPSLNGAAPGT